MKKTIKALSGVLVAVLAVFGAVVLTAAPKVEIPGTSTTAGELRVMDDERAGVIDGRCFMATRSVASTSQQFSFKTGATAPRLTISATTTTTDTTTAYMVEIQWKETVTFNTSTGTELTRWNLNRNSSVTPLARVSYSPAVVSTSTTTMPTEYICADKTRQLGDKQWRGAESTGWLLKKNTWYWFQCTPTSSVATMIYRFNWKE